MGKVERIKGSGVVELRHRETEEVIQVVTKEENGHIAQRIDASPDWIITRLDQPRIQEKH